MSQEKPNSVIGFFVLDLETGNAQYQYYDLHLGRWHTPDPAEQFHNPYLAMGNNPVMYTDPDGEFIVAAILIGAAIGAYIGGSTANDGQMNPGKWNWESGHTWAGMGIGAVIGGAGGYGFAVAGPVVAGGVAGVFPVGGAAVGYGITGGVSMGLAGYGAGFGSAMARSKGNWSYGHQAGMFGMKVGATIGSFAGGVYGLAKGVDFSMPEYEAPPSLEWNKTLTASTGNSGYGMSNQNGLPGELQQDELQYYKTYGFSTGNFVSSETFSFQSGSHIRMDIKNMSYTDFARFNVSNRSYYEYKTNWLGIKRQVWPGGDFAYWLPPRGSASKDFWRGPGAPRNWSFEFNSISDVINLRIRIFSNWLPE